MRKILPYIFGLRALIVIVVMVAGIAGFNLRADAASVNPEEPEPQQTSQGPGATPPTESPDPESTITPEDLPQLQAGLTAEDPGVVTVQLTDTQLDRVREGSTALTWALAVMSFCSIVSAICIAKGSRT